MRSPHVNHSGCEAVLSSRSPYAQSFRSRAGLTISMKLGKKLPKCSTRLRSQVITYDARMTRVLIGLFAIFCVLWPISAQSRGLRAAIFDFELIDTSLEGATKGQRPNETARLARLGDQLRALVTSSGKLEGIDIAPVRSEAHKASLQACGGCDADFAKKLGADVSITGTVQKVSNLILNINLYVRVVDTRAPLVAFPEF